MTRIAHHTPHITHRTGRLHIAIMAVIVLLLALPTAVIDTHSSRHLTSIPPEYDGFLDAVRDAVPMHTRLLVVDPSTDPHQHLYDRSRYVLYPRHVAIQPVSARAISQGALTWRYLLRRARHAHARYVVVWARPALLGVSVMGDPWNWSLPTPPGGALPEDAVRLRDGWGILIDVNRARARA